MCNATTKKCTKCGKKQSLTEFGKRSASPDGLQYNCKSCRKSESKERYEATRNWQLQYRREYYKENRNKVLKLNREYYEKNKKQIANNRRKYLKKLRASNPLYLLAGRCRNRIWYSLDRKGFSKNTETAKMLGCTWKELKDHLESQFTEGMSWDNRSEWHIDHIIPLASANTEEELLALCHYTNLQPLWAKDNLSKRDRLDWKKGDFPNV